jgi:hypothetical protein
MSNIFNGNIDLSYLNDKKIAIVGSSGILLNHKLGDEINNHDFIVRFNAAPTGGFEEFVGNRTDFRCMNTHTYAGTTDRSRFTMYDHNFLDKLENQTILTHNKNLTKSKKIRDNNTVVEISKNFFSKVTKMGNCPEASTGMWGVYIFTHFTNKINLYGFTHHSDKWENRHYWEKINPYNQGVFHNFENEKRFFDNLLNEGKVKKILRK